MKKFMAGSLALWLSGFVFLFCCGTMQFTIAAEADSCPLAKASGHCNKSDQAKDTPTFSGESTGVFNCCEFIPKIYDRFRYLEKAQKNASPTDKPKIERPRFISTQNHFEIVPKFHQTAVIPAKIFVRNCVFRI